MLLRLTPYAILFGLFFAAWLGSEYKHTSESIASPSFLRQSQEDDARRCSDLALGRLSTRSQQDGMTIANRAFDQCANKWNLAADAAREHIGSIILNRRVSTLLFRKPNHLDKTEKDEIMETYRDAYRSSSVAAVRDLKYFFNNTTITKP